MDTFAQVDFNIVDKNKEVLDIIDNQEKIQNNISNLLINYNMDSIKYDENNILPKDNSYIFQKNSDRIPPNLVDINSNILNLNYKLNKDLNIHNVQPTKTILQEGFPTQESTKLNSFDKDLKGLGLNRWYKLYKNPLENTIEPFNRIGDNTVLQTLDTFKSRPVTREQLNGF